MLKNKFHKIRNRDDLTDHMANERTFLAWIRTSITIMAFGFVVEKFSLFIKELTAVVNKGYLTPPHGRSLLQGYSAYCGGLLVALGALLCALAFMKYKHIETQIEQKTYRLTILLDIMLTLSICLIGIFLVMALTL